MSNTDWLTPFLSATPWFAWFFLGLGIPYALWLLPRRDWHDWTMVGSTALALGPLVGTTWLFILGTVAEFQFGVALIGTVILAGIGAGFAYQRRGEVYETTSLPDDGLHFPALKWVVLVMMGVGLLAMAWDTAYFPFLRYDTLWTFGYNAKIFMLERQIPAYIDYYPQLVPLTFTFGDLAWGSHNDHAARAAVPWFFAASVGAVYLLGWRVYQSRLTGLLSAGLWTLLPSSLVWSSSGDLEHSMATYFTLATVFFILAWREETHTRHYGVLSGLMLGGAMWTKPTAGAFVFGVGLVALGYGLYAYRTQRWADFKHRFGLMVLVGVACAPLGGMWYLRNIIAGHAWTNLPPSYWTDLAQRSGMQLVWLYAIAFLVTLYLVSIQRRYLALLGFILLSIAILPTALSIPDGGWASDTTWDYVNGFREPDRRLYLWEFALIILGTAILIWEGRYAWQKLRLPIRQGVVLSLGLGLPFFAVYFWSFSYHYRLGLTVLPLILAAFVALLVGWLMPYVLANRLRQTAVLVVTFTLSLIAPVATDYHVLHNTFAEDGTRTDGEKYAYANPALMQTVAYLELLAQNEGKERYRIAAPGENRLAFFFPTWQIDDETLPTDVRDLEEYDLFIPVFAETLWRNYGLVPNQVQAWLQLAEAYPAEATIPRVLFPITPPIDDGNNRYVIYKVDTAAGYHLPTPENPLENVVYGETLQLLGYDISTRTLKAGDVLTLTLYWRGTEQAPPPADYSVFIHFLDPQTDEFLGQMDGGIMSGLFPTRLFTEDLVITDVRQQSVSEMRPGAVKMRIGVYIPDGPRLTAMVNGEVVGDGVIITEDLVAE